MDGGVDPDHELPGVGLFDWPADLGASFGITLHRLVEGFAQLGDGFTVKSNHIVDAGYAAEENLVFAIIFDPSCVAFVGHRVHGVFPRAFRRLRYHPRWCASRSLSRLETAVINCALAKGFWISTLPGTPLEAQSTALSAVT